MQHTRVERSNVKFVLPPSTTAKLQPCDTGTSESSFLHLFFTSDEDNDENDDDDAATTEEIIPLLNNITLKEYPNQNSAVATSCSENAGPKGKNI